MNEKEKRKDFEQRQEDETVLCTKPFNAESSRLSDEDNPCELVLDKQGV